MKAAVYMTIVAAAILTGWLTLRTKSSRAQIDRLAAMERTCQDLQRQIDERDKIIAELRARTDPPVVTTDRFRGDPAAGLAMEAELQRRLAEVAALQSNAAAMVNALAATRELPEAAEIPLYAQRRRVELSVLRKELDEARQKAAAAYNQTKELLITMNIPFDIAATHPNKALASVELQNYWPYFESKKEYEVQQTLVERLKMRMLEETIEAEVLEAQRKGAGAQPTTPPPAPE